MNKAVVFDLGGTLFEFAGMHLSWTGYYLTGLENVSRKFGLGLSREKLETAEKILAQYNPRVNYRENEIEPDIIFQNATKDWNCNIPVKEITEVFFEGLELEPVIYDYTFGLIDYYRKQGYAIACMTDIPSAMPDELYKSKIRPVIDALDLYVSSQSCGFRKPNPFGLKTAAGHFGLEMEDLLFIGDEEKDRQTAVNAGCDFKFIDSVKHLK